MLTGILGTPCSGKSTLADFLCEYHGFTRLKIKDSDHLSPTFDSGVRNASYKMATDNNINHQDEQQSKVTRDKDHPSTLKSNAQYIEFEDPLGALNYVMLEHRWKQNYVMYPLSMNKRILSELRKRPFFLLISLDAPILLRYQRTIQKLNQHSDQTQLSLEEYVGNHDDLIFSNWSDINSGVDSFFGFDMQLMNPYHTVDQFYAYLKRMDIVNYERCRPSWDTYFIKLSEWSARRSNCMKRRVGCILVKNNRIIATGYNGTPRGLKNCNEGGCPRCNDGNAKCGEALDQCFCIHAEENALLEAGRERIENGGGHTILYCTTCPCIGCAKKIVQAGVKEVVYHQSYGMDSMTSFLFKSCQVQLRQYRGVLEIEEKMKNLSFDIVEEDFVVAIEKKLRELNFLK